ncbi:hypothetical protein DXG03_005768, partial [Asterophora parasitica]
MSNYPSSSALADGALDSGAQHDMAYRLSTVVRPSYGCSRPLSSSSSLSRDYAPTFLGNHSYRPPALRHDSQEHAPPLAQHEQAPEDNHSHPLPPPLQLYHPHSNSQCSNIDSPISNRAPPRPPPPVPHRSPNPHAARYETYDAQTHVHADVTLPPTPRATTETSMQTTPVSITTLMRIDEQGTCDVRELMPTRLREPVRDPKWWDDVETTACHNFEHGTRGDSGERDEDEEQQHHRHHERHVFEEGLARTPLDRDRDHDTRQHREDRDEARERHLKYELEWEREEKAERNR